MIARTIECPSCDHKFSTDYKLRQHILVCHKGIYCVRAHAARFDLCILTSVPCMLGTHYRTETETCSNPLCDYTTTTGDLQTHRSRNNHLINEILVSTPLPNSASPTDASTSSEYKEYMNEVDSYFDVLEEQGLVRKHPRYWPQPTEVDKPDGAGSMGGVSGRSIVHYRRALSIYGNHAETVNPARC